MSSERRIRASRANGAKSRGPKTPESKARADAGNRKHGLQARNAFEDENPQAFASLLAAYRDRLHPQNEIERALVEEMAASRCRLKRVWAVERSTLQAAANRQDPATQEPGMFAVPARNLELLGRAEGRFGRQFTRSLTALLKARRKPKKCVFPIHLVPKSDTLCGAANPGCSRLSGGFFQAARASRQGNRATVFPIRLVPKSDT
jgi:hypothetical protein